MSEVFFTADTHYGSPNIIKYCNRPFQSVAEMNETMIERHNKKVSRGDRVYHLGDVFSHMKPADGFEILQRLNGQQYLVRGNHDDYNACRVPEAFIWIKDISNFKLGGPVPVPVIVLCHYALRSWEMRNYGAWHLYGHSHGKLPGDGLSFDVGVDCWNFEPLSYEEVKIQMEKQQWTNPEK